MLQRIGMRRSSRKQKAADGEAVSVESDDPDAPVGGGDEDAEKEARRQQRVAAMKESIEFAQNMYDLAWQMLHQHGLTTIPTEGAGDCWLIAILAAAGLMPRNLVARLNSDDRSERITKLRMAAL